MDDPWLQVHVMWQLIRLGLDHPWQVESSGADMISKLHQGYQFWFAESVN